MVSPRPDFVARLQGRAMGALEVQEGGQAGTPGVLASNSRAKGKLALARGSRAGASMKTEAGLGD